MGKKMWNEQDIRRLLLIKKDEIKAEEAGLADRTAYMKFLTVSATPAEALYLFEHHLSNIATYEIVDFYTFFDYKLYIVLVTVLQEDQVLVHKKLKGYPDLYALDGATTFLQRKQSYLNLYIKRNQVSYPLFSLFPSQPTELITWLQSHMTDTRQRTEQLYIVFGAEGEKEPFFAQDEPELLGKLQKLYPDALDWESPEAVSAYWRYILVGKETGMGIHISSQLIRY